MKASNLAKFTAIFPIAFAAACAVTSEPEPQAAAEEIVVVEPLAMVGLEYTPPSDDMEADSTAASESPDLELEGGNSVLSLPETDLKNPESASALEEAVTVEAQEEEGAAAEVTVVPPPATVTFHFATGSAEIVAEDLIHLSEHAAYLSAHPDATLTISGHSDNRGSNEFNLELSKKRTEAVAEALRQFGAPEGQLIMESFGEEQPMVDASRWDENRRVELQYVEPTKLTQR